MWFRSILRRPAKPEADLPGRPAAVSGPLLRPQLWGQLDRLRLRAGRGLPGASAGRRASPRRRPSMDFREHRQYVPGDDVRFVDWKASARHEQIFLRQGEQSREIRVYILLDTSASMSWGEPAKQDTAIRLAAALGYLALSHDDRLQILPLESTEQEAATNKPLGSLKGKGQFPVLLQYLNGLSFGGTASLERTCSRLRGQAARGGLVLLISDLLDLHDLEPAVAALPPPAWEVNVLHLLHPWEIEPELNGDYEFIDVETGRAANYDIDEKALRSYRSNFRNWREQLELTLVENKAFYMLLSSQASLEKEIIPQLRRVHLIEAL